MAVRFPIALLYPERHPGQFVARASAPPMANQLIGLTGIESGEAMGSSGALLPSTTRAFTIFINGVDCTKYIANPSISINMQIGSLATASFRVEPDMVNGVILSTLSPDVRQAVVIHHNTSGYRIFSGFIQSLTTEQESGTAQFIKTKVDCSDWGSVLMHRAMAKWYTTFLGSFAPIIARDVVDRFLIGTGITFDGIGPLGAYFGEQLFNWRMVGEVFRQTCDSGGLDFRIDQYGQLKFIDRTTGYAAAPFSITQNNGLWNSLTAGKNLGRYANRVIVKNSQDIGALWTDSDTASAALAYYTTYPQSVKPLVLVAGVQMIVAAMADLGSTPGAQYYYIPDGPGLFATALAPTTGAMEIIYPSRTSFVAIAQDDAEIALYGQYDHIEEVSDQTDLDALQATADNLLVQLLTVPVNITVETEEMGLEPGQLLTVNANAVVDDFLIEQVAISEWYADSCRATVQASNASQRNGSALVQNQRRIARERNPVDRVTDDIRFVLAETIEGVTNPGLTVGVKQAFRTYAKHAGYAKQCRLHFKSVDDGTPTTSIIEIDVLQNGVSIFPAGEYMVFPAGATSEQVQFWFSANPLRVDQGDIFTVEVISADSAATDGWLHLQVQG